MPKVSTDEENEENGSWNNWPLTIRKCLAEFVGDLIFIFIGSVTGTGTGGTLLAASAHGLTIGLLVMSLGHISGGHFNPAVTLSVFVSGNIHAAHVPLYWISQAVTTPDAYCAIHGGITDISGSTYIGYALVMEIMATFILSFTVLNSAVHSNGKNVLHPLAIGLSLMVSICAGGNISGASANPARSFGPLIAYSVLHSDAGCGGAASSDPVYDSGWNHCWIYFVGPVIGGTIAGLLYRTFFSHNHKRWLLKTNEGRYTD